MNLDGFNFEKVGKKKWLDTNITVMHSRIPGRKRWLGIGVDPGRSFGVATLAGREVWVFYGQMPKEEKKWMYGITAYDLMANPRRYYGEGPAVVEGAAYKEPYGQADLGHVRMGFVLGLRYAGYNVDIVPPATIRAQALGSGKLGGLEVWPEINHNGGDALAAALYAAGLRRD